LKVEPDADKQPDEEDVLQKGVRQIVLSRETIPRAPRWARAFRRALFRFARDLADTESTRDDSTCHSERSEESRSCEQETLRSAQGDRLSSCDSQTSEDMKDDER